jgi:hypothetical protein
LAAVVAARVLAAVRAVETEEMAEMEHRRNLEMPLHILVRAA